MYKKLKILTLNFYWSNNLILNGGFHGRYLSLGIEQQFHIRCEHRCFSRAGMIDASTHTLDGSHPMGRWLGESCRCWRITKPCIKFWIWWRLSGALGRSSSWLAIRRAPRRNVTAMSKPNSVFFPFMGKIKLFATWGIPRWFRFTFWWWIWFWFQKRSIQILNIFHHIWHNGIGHCWYSYI